MSHLNQNSVTKAMIYKDWYFNKAHILLFGLIGLVAAFMLSFESVIFYVGQALLISMVIIIGALLVFSTVVNERKKQTLAFLMSLPITCMDYTKAKLIFNLSVYFVAWSILTVATLGIIMYSTHIPNGLIPYSLIILLELMIAFILVLGTALVSESEIWSIVVMTITNIGVSVFMFMIAFIKDIGRHMDGTIPVWNKTALTIITIEIVVGIAIIVLTLYLQSRKKDFI